MQVEPALAVPPRWPSALDLAFPDASPPRLLPENTDEWPADAVADGIELPDASRGLDHIPVRPLPSPSIARSSRWNAALICSLAFHAAVAGLLVSLGVDQMLMAGSEDAGIVLQGNAADDQAADGDIVADGDVTEVTLVEMVKARAVEAGATVAITVNDATAVVQPLATEVALPEQSERVAELPAEASVSVAEGNPVEPVTAETAQPASDSPIEAVQPEFADVVARSPEVAQPAPAESILAAETSTETAENVVPPEIAPALATANTAPKAAPPAPIKEEPPKPQTAQLKKVVAKKQVAVAAKRAAKTQKAPTPTTARKKSTKAGSGGRNQTDAKRGADDGAADGKTAATGKSADKTSAAGNAAVSNYPGKVAAKLRRSLRYPAEARKGRLKGQVRVSFTVSASGGVTGVRLAGSSGSPVLDRAALDAVRRAAPFPPIPAEAHRSSWSFTVPLAFKQQR